MKFLDILVHFGYLLGGDIIFRLKALLDTVNIYIKCN